VTPSPRIRLDSRVPGTRWACRPGEPALVLECEAASRVALLRNQHGIVRMWDDPLAALEWMPQHLAEIGSPEARWIGYLSYDLARLFEAVPERTADDLQMPLFAFTLHHVPVDLPWAGRTHRPQANQTLSSNFTPEAYVDMVERAIDRIVAGEIHRVHLAQRFTAALTEPPSRIYDRLRRESPALYGAYLDHLDYALICNSAELFLKVERARAEAGGRRSVITRPIHATHARGSGMALQLRDSEKDQAELDRIIELERSALARVCEIDSVRVTPPGTMEGLLRADVGFVDLLRATSPPQSSSGTPKARAMEVIDELEPHRRGPYGGAIGYLAADGRMEFNLATRTMIVRDGLVHIPAGATIVAESDPGAEYDETIAKAQAMFAALGIDPSKMAGG
jgi:anthranilate/para-aminobenzoate synthase component I